MPFFLTPEQKQATFWWLLWLAFAALLYLLGPVLTPFIAAAILAYVLNGPVDRLCRLRIRRWPVPRALAVLLVMLLFAALFGALALTVVPVLDKEIPLLVAQLPAFLVKLDALLSPRLAQLGIHVRLDGGGIKDLLTQQVAGGGDALWGQLLAGARIGGSALLGWAATLALVPVVLFYLLLDWHALLAQVQGAIPRRWVGATTGMAREVDALLGQYLRGQLLVMFVLAVYYSAALAGAGFDVALPVGILTGLLVFIPYLGFGLGLALALIAAVLQFNGLTGLAYVAVIYGAGQVLEGFFLTPRLVGERIGMNPLAVIFALLAFGQLFGFAGVLLALPASAVLMVAFRHLRRHYLRSTFYNA
ncbi:AI-2E family transporter [Massilia terrae]|uniref:AI-2E family transporter n=1 Tax=Massilia terrae TaxID=1811224 RepID=A0ABT2D2K1_9BURK|nr:AI-2E family transporter [Massilia terrae]MCS0660459.1 AI-2E family transporter [Massilia terrae]